MQKLIKYLCFVFLLTAVSAFSQTPTKPNSVTLYQQIKKLNFLGSVLYIAAHPDDENTRLITYLANEQLAETAYLSLTRGDGGQNLIGPELRELLGVIRTQELIEARKVDGGTQFFSRANDFGFSKNPTETLQIWDKDAVLHDVVLAIRKFQPDVIINRFDARSPGTTHGHHTSSALLSLEAFDLSNLATSYPNQLQNYKPWQAKRLFFNTSWWFYGSKDKFEKADKTNLYRLKTGVYYAAEGKSNQEIAALSRSKHQSQGFGTAGERGDDTEYLEFLKGSPVSPDQALFAGIDTSWNRVKGGKKIDELLTQTIHDFDFTNPAKSLPNLVMAYQLMQEIEDEHWKSIKSQEIKAVIAGCAGLYLEGIADTQETTPNSRIKIQVEAINRSAAPIQLSAIRLNPETSVDFKAQELETNKPVKTTLNLVIPSSMNYSQPYWLANPYSEGMYQVPELNAIGLPEKPKEITLTFDLTLYGATLSYARVVHYQYTDDVKGEVHMPLDIVPAVSLSITDKVVLFPTTQSKKITVKLKAGAADVQGVVQLELPANWSSSPASVPFRLANKNEELAVDFTVTPSDKLESATLMASAIVDGVNYNKEQISIQYPHIAKQQILKPAETKVVRLALKIGKQKIGYLMGAGDAVPTGLTQMGYDVKLLDPHLLSPDYLSQFDVVITGIRAYNTVQELASKQTYLLDFVKNGKTLIVQYNTLDDLTSSAFSPFPLKISRDRVTEEQAEVRFLAPNHPLVNKPNVLSAADFLHWKQEIGLYFPNQWDAAFTPILSANDTGETAKNGLILHAKYGTGNYIYTGLSFFRELPEGVPGAYRLLANLISIK
jgi:LmbE family N-acetylglucosaminyl deacetylase